MLDFLKTPLTVLHIFVAFFLVLIILIQPGKSGGIGAALGGAGAQQVFGGRGAGNFLSRLTWISGSVFFLTSMTLAFVSSSSDDSLSRYRPDVEQIALPTKSDEAPQAPAPESDPAAPAAGDEAANEGADEAAEPAPEGEPTAQPENAAPNEAQPAEPELPTQPPSDPASAPVQPVVPPRAPAAAPDAPKPVLPNPRAAEPSVPDAPAPEAPQAPAAPVQPQAAPPAAPAPAAPAPEPVP